MVAQFEAFQSDLISRILKIDKRRLKIRINGIDHVNKIDVSNILDVDSYDVVIENIIQKELSNIFYASSSKQNEYLQKIIGIEFDDRLNELSEKWIEYKATRDLIVHNAGIVNKKYLNKVGDMARWRLDEQVIVDEKYLNGFIAESKSFIGKICTSVQKKNKV